MKRTLFAALMAALILPSAAKAATTEIWAGSDTTRNSFFYNVGGMTAASGQDILMQDGWLARADAGYGQYTYNRSGDIDGDVFDADLMAGYGSHYAQGHSEVYLGLDWVHHHLDPSDPLNDVSGSRLGLKAALDFTLTPLKNIAFDGSGNFSTAFSTYATHLDALYRFGIFSLGPEAGLFGNSDFRETRIGAEAGNIDLGFADTSLHLGYANSTYHDQDGFYGSIGFARDF
jgi:opacity protein-like surface antigen